VEKVESLIVNKVRVLFFATFRDLVGEKEVELSIEENILVSEFKEYLFEKFPAIAAHKASILVAINKDFSFDDEIIPENAEIAIFPPVSGGSDRPEYYFVTEEPIDINGLVEKITLPSTGAICFFTGMVRGITTRGKKFETKYLNYDAYTPMAEEKMRQVANEIRERWPEIVGIVVVQRIGDLSPSTPTVMIACSAAHRDTGVFEGARYGIDRLKEIVPVWKKEIGVDGEKWIEGNYHPTSKDK
jgi:MoaE-MoaD fusion protein